MIENVEVTSAYTKYKNLADEVVALQILELVEKSEDVSQRKIKKQTGLATGLVHSFMRQVINKGWVKTKQVSAKRWLYYLTPEGFTEKSRLTIKYLSVTLESYRSTQGVIAHTLDNCVSNGWQRLVVAGTDHLAEMLILNIKAHAELELAGVVTTDSECATHFSVELLPFESINQLHYDRIIASDATFIEYCNSSDNGQALGSRLIHLSTDGGKNG